MIIQPNRIALLCRLPQPSLPDQRDGCTFGNTIRMQAPPDGA